VPKPAASPVSRWSRECRPSPVSDCRASVAARGRRGPAHGYALVSIGHAPTLRAAFGSVLYLGLIALLSLGIGAVFRDTAVSTGIALGLLYLPPLLAQLVSGPWRRHIQQIAPMTAGLAIQATRNIRSLPVSPWTGLGVLAAWAAGMLLIGLAVLKARDA
jgi:ABC-2 type transport system permease protein